MTAELAPKQKEGHLRQIERRIERHLAELGQDEVTVYIDEEPEHYCVSLITVDDAVREHEFQVPKEPGWVELIKSEAEKVLSL